MNVKKLMIFGGIGLILVLGAGAGALFLGPMLKGGSEHNADQAADSDHVAVEEAPRVAEPPPSRPTAPAYEAYGDEEEEDTGYKTAVNQTHLVNLAQGERGQRGAYLRCQISIIVIDEQLGKSMASDNPTYESEKAKAIAFDRLSEIEFVEVNEPETKDVVAADIKDKLNEQFRPKPPTDPKAKPRPRRPISEVLVVQWAIQVT